jgi:hypothetical protein
VILFLRLPRVLPYGGPDTLTVEEEGISWHR